ncbi:MAG: NAD(P)/FAD-dependent oxidoreductase [Alicyclobacillaceae bacterium]|uniref:NAD(P)/FAD-dependent oxidoreductase n=1 Tax=Alicyclobacillus sp. SP_1 TaxID=2942475 RepID=UPI002157FAD9|nr:NAD(P)/FAD-dependent oxidoreductase [Alicyclobacillus sp. SP_1]MCY0888634.1 NAD(P)/FAD-dependent oxidoreductase [Alicyclobacillaceae bacterium]MCY0896641.1 NAD(P)/FAD-dependent oxidoreductase [Alicyclobacillaceae bacterium]
MTHRVASDVVVIGGGPAGLMAAIAAAETGAATTLLEKGDRLGRKLGISGGGRCNVTNAKPLAELMENIPGNARFLHSALSRYNNQDIMGFFEGLGIALKEEDRGRVFPKTDKALTVVAAMVEAVREAGVQVYLETPVRKLLSTEQQIHGVELQGGQQLLTKAVVLATGGCSVPQTGSTGDGYPWAARLGHTIVQPFPTEVPLTSDDPHIVRRALQGLSFQNVPLTVLDDQNKRWTTETGDVLFTHFGLSGPAALRCSHYVSVALQKRPSAQLRVEMDLLPEEAGESFREQWNHYRHTAPRKQVKTVLLDVLPERMVETILARSGIDGNVQSAHLKNIDIDLLERQVHHFPVRITGTLPLAKATVTGGGVSVRDIDPKTMASKLCRGLYFAGEVMDVHAHTGGYNITVAFSTGRAAGASAARYAIER